MGNKLKERHKMKRKSIYVDEEKHKKMKAVLILEGKSLSEWVREEMDKFLAKGGIK